MMEREGSCVKTCIEKLQGVCSVEYQFRLMGTQREEFSGSESFGIKWTEL